MPMWLFKGLLAAPILFVKGLEAQIQFPKASVGRVKPPIHLPQGFSEDYRTFVLSAVKGKKRKRYF